VRFGIIEIDFGIGEVVDQNQVMMFGECDGFFKKLPWRRGRCGVGGIAQVKQLRAPRNVFVDEPQIGNKITALVRR
jgi:hypothetical protein